jgi:peptide-methionine (S)-S-oxide reductase
MEAGLEKATFAGGCFWCMDAIFKNLRGIEKVEAGYAGGTLEHPSYEQVSTGNTGYAEAVQVSFDPRVISYEDLVRVFFHLHDPTTLNRQGADVGAQYRSAIFFHSEEQRLAAQKTKEEIIAAKLWSRPIVTSIEPLKNYYPAEDYHQDYYAKHPYQPYCQLVIGPKIAKLKQEFKDKLKTPG